MLKTAKISLVLFALLILSAFSVMAIELTPVTFKLESSPVKDRMLIGDSAEFFVSITNYHNETESFRFLPLEDVKWTPQFVPVTDRVMTVEPGETKQTKVLLKPSDVPDDAYNVRMIAENLRSKARLGTVMRVYVGPHPSMFSPDIIAHASVPSKMDPNQDYDVKVSLENQNILALDNVKVSVNGDLIDNTQVLHLAPEEHKTLSFAINMPKEARPMTGKVRVVVENQKKIFYDKELEFEVIEFLPPFKKEIQTKKSFLKTERIITLTNEGNSLKEKPVRLETTRRANIFTSTKPKAIITQDAGNMYYTWDVSLEKDASTSIQVTTSYRWLFFLVLLSTLAYIAYFLLRTPISVSKQFKDVKYDEGSISEGRVVLHLKNRTRSKIKNVQMIERLPHVVGIKKGSFQHTLEPNKAYKHGKEGIILEYKIPVLEAKEERLVSYTFKSKINIIGGITIKPTIVKFKAKSGHTEKALSGQLDIPGTA